MTTTGTSPTNQTYVDGVALWEDNYLYAFVQPHDTPHGTGLIYRLDLQKKRWSKVGVCSLASLAGASGSHPTLLTPALSQQQTLLQLPRALEPIPLQAVKQATIMMS